jgi:hypothetical protein
MAAIVFNFSLTKDAGTNSFTNKNICAPPDLDLNTINGKFLSFIFCTNSL